MSEWSLAAIVVIAALLPCLGVCVLADAAHGLAAFEVAGTLGTSALMLLAQAFHRQPFIDLAVVLALTSIVGSLAFARMMEHDL